MFCRNCGANNADNAAFCVNCGATLNAEQPVQQPVYQQPVQQPVYQQPVQQPVYQQPVRNVPVPGKGMGIAGMILGIISLALFCIWYLAIPCAIVGAILGGVALKKAKEAGMKNGMATAGLACSLVALGITLLFVILGIVGLASLGAF